MNLTLLRVIDLKIMGIGGLNFNALVFNAPRPLYGSLIGDKPACWEDEFRHGIFYAAILPEEDYAWDWIKHNLQDDAYLLQNVTTKQVEEWGRNYCEQNMMDYEDFEFEDVCQSFRQHHASKVIEVNSLEEVLQAYQAPIGD